MSFMKVLFYSTLLYNSGCSLKVTKRLYEINSLLFIAVVALIQKVFIGLSYDRSDGLNNKKASPQRKSRFILFALKRLPYDRS